MGVAERPRRNTASPRSQSTGGRSLPPEAPARRRSGMVANDARDESVSAAGGHHDRPGVSGRSVGSQPSRQGESVRARALHRKIMTRHRCRSRLLRHSLFRPLSHRQRTKVLGLHPLTFILTLQRVEGMHNPGQERTPLRGYQDRMPTKQAWDGTNASAALRSNTASPRISWNWVTIFASCKNGWAMPMSIRRGFIRMSVRKA